MQITNILDRVVEYYLFPSIPNNGKQPVCPTFNVGGTECLLVTRSDAKCWVFYCHGNMVTLSDLYTSNVAKQFVDKCNCNFVAPAYPTDMRSGALKGDQIHAQVLQAYRRILQDQSTPVYLVGRSLGVGVALRLAMEDKPAGIACISGFCSVRQLVPCAPLRCCVSEQFDNNGMIGSSALETISKLVIHGNSDSLIPFEHAENLADSSENASLHKINDMDHTPSSSQWNQMLDIIGKFIDVETTQHVADAVRYPLWKC